MTTLTARAVLLDMDGTLVDSTAVVERLWLEWASQHGLDADVVLSTIHGRQGQESMAILLPDRPDAENITENRMLLERETAELDGVVAIPGAVELVTGLHGIPHAIVTSATVPLMRARMGVAGVGVPEVIVTAEDVRASKPDPEGFARAAELLGVDAADCVVFEDSSNGIAAGLAAGMRVIGVGPAAAAASPTHLVADLTEVSISPSPDGIVITLVGS